MRPFLFALSFIYCISFITYYLIPCGAFFWNIPFGPKLNIASMEFNKKIKYSLTNGEQETINKINGFFGMIGPNVNISTTDNLYDLFIGDGVVQGIFLDRGELISIKHFIRTEKLVYEENNGKIPQNKIIGLIFFVLNKFGVLPNLLGVANTALLNIRNETYALYERDQPYSIDVDFDHKHIKTIRKISSISPIFFSAHSKYTSINPSHSKVETIDYNILENGVSYYEMNTKFDILRKKKIKMNYLPVVHDFWSSHDKIIITDSPLSVDLTKIFNQSMPVMLNARKNTVIHILDKQRDVVESYPTNSSFYLFHYGDVIENPDTIEIYASIYDYLDFSQLNIKGNYRKIVIHKTNRSVSIENDPIFENLDLDFPIRYENRIVFRNIENQIINGFVVCEKMKLVKKIFFKNRFICGEHAITMIEKTPFLLAFAYDTNNYDGYFIVINMHTYKVIEIPLNHTLNIGFHSIFLRSARF